MKLGTKSNLKMKETGMRNQTWN